MSNGDRKRTPIPRRDIEQGAAKGPSKCCEYKLSPEELAEIRAKYPATKRDKKFKPPIEIKTRPKEELSDMAKFTMTEEEYKKAIADGKTKEQIAKECGVTVQAIDYHISKWAKEGKSPDPAGEQPPKPRPATELELLDKAEKEIERLTLRVANLESERDAVQSEVGRIITDRDDVADERDLAIGEATRLTEELERISAERDAMAAELERWKARAADAAATRDAAENELAQVSDERNELEERLSEVKGALTVAQMQRGHIMAERDKLLAELEVIQSSPITATLITDEAITAKNG
uniref:hypothetical protein n=1 Tax=Paenibacillus zanthoxyli TaxID=369399 RepID=UPI000567923E